MSLIIIVHIFFMEYTYIILILCNYSDLLLINPWIGEK